MNTKTANFHDHADISILKEVNILADAIKLTLGPKAHYDDYCDDDLLAAGSLSGAAD